MLPHVGLLVLLAASWLGATGSNSPHDLPSAPALVSGAYPDSARPAPGIEMWRVVLAGNEAVAGAHETERSPQRSDSNRSRETEKWIPLVPQGNLDAWEIVGDAQPGIGTDGALRVVCPSGCGHCGLRSREAVEDFEWRFEVLVPEHGRGSVQFRCRADESPPRFYCALIDLDHSPAFPGSVRGLAEARGLNAEAGTWFEMRIVAVGASISIDVNGEVMSDFIFTRHDLYRRGPLMIPGMPAQEAVSFRNLEVLNRNRND